MKLFIEVIDIEKFMSLNMFSRRASTEAHPDAKWDPGKRCYVETDDAFRERIKAELEKR